MDNIPARALNMQDFLNIHEDIEEAEKYSERIYNLLQDFILCDLVWKLADDEEAE